MHAKHKIRTMLKITRNLEYYRDLILVLTQKELKVRYKNSTLGYLWSIANPLAFAFVFFIVFGLIMKVQKEQYVLFLLTGLFPWQWFSNSVNVSPMLLFGNASIVKKLNFPKEIIPLATVLNDTLHFILSIPVIILFFPIYNKIPSFYWIWEIPLLLIAQFLMIYGISLIVSSVNLFLRDLERLVNIMVTVLFYFTPIVYSETMIPIQYRYLIYFNPLATLMINWRNVLLNGQLDIKLLAITLIYGGIIFVAGHLVYKKLSLRFAEVL